MGRYGMLETPRMKCIYMPFEVMKEKRKKKKRLIINHKEIVRENFGLYHSSHGSRRVIGVKVGGSTYSLLLDDVGGASRVGRRGGHHVIGWVGVRGVATAPGGG